MFECRRGRGGEEGRSKSGYVMSDALHKWVDLILGLFASYRAGEGMKYQTIEAKYGRTFGKER